MDYTETEVLCTKHRLWKKPMVVKQIIDLLLENGFTFKEVVLGEPNNFIFADSYEELDDIFRRKGFYGIRIKVLLHDSLLEINSNTDGINNVQYTIFGDENTFYRMKEIIPSIQNVIKPSSNQIEHTSEFIQNHRKLRNFIILVLIATTLYFLGIYVFLFDIVRIILSFSPFLTIYILYLIFRRRR